MIAQLTRAAGDALGDVVRFIPLFLAFLAILIVGYIVARVLENVTDRILEGVGFDRLVQRGGVNQVMEQTRYDPSSLLARIVYYIVLLFTLQLAFGVFGPNPVSDILNAIIGYLPRLFVAGLILVVGAAVAAIARDVIQAAIGGVAWGRAVATASSIAIIAIAIFAALDELNIAPLIVTSLFVALLAIVAGSTIIAVGGGGIQPMREYWQRALTRMEQEAPAMQAQMEGAGERARERVKERGKEAERERKKKPAA